MANTFGLKDNHLNEETGIYRVVTSCENNEKTTEEFPVYNLTALEELKADVGAGENGCFRFALLGKKASEFQEFRVLLAGVKNTEIYFPELKAEAESFTVDVRFLMDSHEYGRNKSFRILLETIENGEYHRYNLMDDKKAREARSMQKDLTNWAYVNQCSELVRLQDETGEKDKLYGLFTYMDKKGRWFVSPCAEQRAETMAKLCSLRTFSMKNGKIVLNLKVEKDRKDYELDSVIFLFRSKLQEEREEHPFHIESRKTKGGFEYLKASLNLSGIYLKSLYWDVRVRFVNRSTGDTYDSMISMSKSLRYFTAFFYNGHYKGEDNFFMYPYNTGSKKLAFQYREAGEFDKASFHIREFAAFFLFYLLYPYWKSRHIQLVYEKFCMMAQDNGYYFFRHCMENGEEKRQKNHIYYVITKDSADRDKLAAYKNRVIDFMSLRHMIYMQAAELLVSTDTRNHLYAMRQRGSILKRSLRKKPLVFLQHGVTALKKVDFFYGKGKSGSCNLFVVTSDFEKKIVEDYFGYNEDEIVNSGFARWDVLEDKSEGLREILIMPTWRSWLENATPGEFKESDYFRNYMILLNSQRFHDFLEKNDLKANFYLHSKFREFMQDFSVESERIRLIAFGEEPANELMMRCKMLVTDYSSVCWDVFYLDKPVVFFQFDRDKYEEAHGSYLDMSKDLFGDCAEDVDGLLTYMENCANDNFVIQPQYEEMRNNYYKYYDDQNSRRICDAIVEKWKRD